tara:strand:+ start:421 stop:900 length:480 start_codon:yes stop_codon:yes gene_type:complete
MIGRALYTHAPLCARRRVALQLGAAAMGQIDLLRVILGAGAFFLVGMVWYGVLFGKIWKRAIGRSEDEDFSGDRPIWLVFGLTFAFALLISLTLAHQFAMSSPSVRAMMMISVGYGLMLMVPAIGIRYLYLNAPWQVFAIDAGFFVTAMAAMGGVFVLL